MSCCNGKGVVRFRYHDGSPDEFGICLCQEGLELRDDHNAGRHTGYPLWNIWAAERQIPFERVGPIEEFLDDQELAAMFPDYQPGVPAASSNQIAEAMRTRSPRL